MNEQKSDEVLEHRLNNSKDRSNSTQSLEESIRISDDDNYTLRDKNKEADEEIIGSESIKSDEAIIISTDIIDGFLDEGAYEEEESKICESLKQQITAELEESSVTFDHKLQEHRKSNQLMKRVLLVSGIVLGVLLLLTVWLVGTKSGRAIIYRIAGGYIYGNLDKEDHITAAVDIKDDTHSSEDTDSESIQPEEPPKAVITPAPDPRSEDYVTNYLIFGVEEIEHAKNTDTIMLASINSKDNTIKLTSLLRDTYIEMDQGGPKKLNAIYASSGAPGLVEAVQKNFLIKIDGYAYINFEAFETIVDYLGGIPIELGKEEAHYLNTTNYISQKANRNVQPGWNDLNGNQALGYCRVRRVPTLGGANDDYGRTLRQRRVLNALFNRYKSKNIFELLKVTNVCLGYVKTNLTRDQIEAALEVIVENGITKMNTLRVPVNGAFESPREWNGIDDPLVLDWQANIIELYQFIYLDTKEEARKALEPKPTGL